MVKIDLIWRNRGVEGQGVDTDSIFYTEGVGNEMISIRKGHVEDKETLTQLLL